MRIRRRPPRPPRPTHAHHGYHGHRLHHAYGAFGDSLDEPVGAYRNPRQRARTADHDEALVDALLMGSRSADDATLVSKLAHDDAARETLIRRHWHHG